MTGAPGPGPEPRVWRTPKPNRHTLGLLRLPCAAFCDGDVIVAKAAFVAASVLLTTDTASAILAIADGDDGLALSRSSSPVDTPAFVRAQHKPLKALWSLKGFTALDAENLNAVVKGAAFFRTEELTVLALLNDALSAIGWGAAVGTIDLLTNADVHGVAMPRTEPALCPRLVEAELLAARLAGTDGADVLADGVDDKFCARGLAGSAEKAANQFNDLGVIFPDNAGTGIKNQFAHIVDVPALIRLRVEEDADAESAGVIRN